MAKVYQIVAATVQDKNRVDKFIREVFFRDEPLSVYLKLAEEEEPEEEDEDMEVLSQGLSLLALDEHGDMVGMALSGEMTPEDADYLEKKAIDGQEKGFLKIMRFLAIMDRKSDSWEKLGVSSGMGVYILAVAPQARGQGLGRRLLQRSCEVAKEKQLPIVRVDCTSYYSASICEKMGMTCIFSLPYNEYVDQEGNQVFSPSAPHSVFRMFDTVQSAAVRTWTCSATMWSRRVTRCSVLQPLTVCSGCLFRKFDTVESAAVRTGTCSATMWSRRVTRCSVLQLLTVCSGCLILFSQQLSEHGHVQQLCGAGG